VAYPYDGMFYPTLPEDTQDFGQVLSGVGRSLRDISRGVSYYPYDLLGSGVDVANLALGAVGLGSERPVLGSDYLRNIARSLGMAQEPTGSATENITRLAAGLTNPMAGARAVGRVGDITTEQANRAADALVRQITGNPQATAPAVLEAAGGMVPLSRMFKPEQVKSVLPETKVVDEAGNPQIVYHGTPDAFESNIRAESYFTSQPELANMYTNTSASSIATRPKLGEAPAIYPSYLNIKKPFDTRDPKIRKEFMEEYYGKYSRTPLSNRSGLPDWTEGRDLKEWIEESGKKYDGLILDEGGIPMPDGTVMSRGISYVPFKEEQIKSAISDPSFAGLLEPKTSKFEMPSFASLRPETTDDVDKIYDYLEKQAKKSGFRTEVGASNVSNSRYLTIEKDLGNDEISTIEVRISAHGDRHPFTYATDGKISIDPSRGGVDLETTLWDLQEKGYDLIK
jgi:hypothetical protein